MKKYKFTINGNDYEVAIKGIEGDLAQMEVNGSPYSIKINEEVKQASKTPTLVRTPVKTRPGEDKEKMAPMPVDARPSSKTIKSPLPGNVLNIMVGEGDSFKEGDVLMVMESMKMENNILAERDGTVTKVAVSVGDAVLQADVLFEFV